MDRHHCVERAAPPGRSDAEVVQRRPLGDQLFVADEAVTGLLIRLNPVLVAQSVQLLPQGVEDRMVLVQGTEANTRTLTEVEEPGSLPLRRPLWGVSPRLARRT